MLRAVTPAFGRVPTTFEVEPAPANDDAAVMLTLDKMCQLTRTSPDPDYQRQTDQVIASMARRCASNLPAGAGRREKAAAAWRFIKSRVRFVNDENFAPFTRDARELLIQPARLLTMPRPKGDCDDFSMGVASLCLALGVPVRFVAAGADRRDPSRFSHVYAEAILEDGSPYPLDASHGPRPGWEVPDPYRRLPWRTMEPAASSGSGVGTLMPPAPTAGQLSLLELGLVGLVALAVIGSARVVR